MTHLVWVLRDPLIKLVAKGEPIPRRFNPGDVADKVTFLTTGVGFRRQYTQAGRTSVEIRRLPHSALLWPYHGRLPQDLGDVDLIRASAGSEGVIATRLRRIAKAPVALSLHTDRREMLEGATWGDRWHRRRDLKHTLQSLAFANRTAHVYKSLESYDPEGALLYNIVQAPAAPTSPIPNRIVCVGAQDQWRDPRPLLRALELLPEEVHLVMIGDGPLHKPARKLARDLGLNPPGEPAKNRVFWYKSMPNAAVMKATSQASVCWSACTANGIGKPTLEALVCQRPIFAPIQHRVPELAGAAIMCHDIYHRAMETIGVLRAGFNAYHLYGEPWYRENYGSPAAAEERWRAWMWD